MTKLLRFGIGSNRYEFLDNTQLIQLGVSPVRFGQMNVNSIDIPGADGALPINWHGRHQTSSRDIKMRFRYTGDGTQSDVEDFADALHEMTAWGYTRLFKRKTDGTDFWTWAHCSNVVVQSELDSRAHVWPEGELSFFCPTARWYRKPGMAFLDNGEIFFTDFTLPNPQVDGVTYVDGNTVNVTNNGNAPAGVQVWFEAPAGETVTNPKISRLAVDGVSLADSLEYLDTLSDGDVIHLDARKHLVQENMVTSGDLSKVNALRSVWFEIPSGTHTITINGTFSNGVILTLDFWDTYY